MQTINAIKFEVIRNALIQATEEMAITLRRSAYSTNVKTRQDFSCAFFDSKLRIGNPISPNPITMSFLIKIFRPV